MKEYYTTQEVADRLGVSVFTIRRYIRSGKLRSVRLEGSYRIRGSDLQAFLSDREIGPDLGDESSTAESGSTSAGSPEQPTQGGSP
jgi:excisionase family DNA binding protein